MAGRDSRYVKRSELSGIAGASTLDDLTDVGITAPSSGQTLQYNGASWVNDFPDSLYNGTTQVVSTTASSVIVNDRGLVVKDLTAAAYGEIGLVGPPTGGSVVYFVRDNGTPLIMAHLWQDHTTDEMQLVNYDGIINIETQNAGGTISLNHNTSTVLNTVSDGIVATRRVNVAPAAGDLASPANGDIWYNSTSGKFKARQAGTSYEFIHDPVTISDTSTINLSLTGQALTADAITQMSVTSDASGLKLSGDASSPGNYKFYGTNGSGTKGWYDPVSVTDTNTINFGFSSGAITGDVNTQMSLTSDASGIKLSGDASSPGNNYVYATNGSGTKGWYQSSAYNSTFLIKTSSSAKTTDTALADDSVMQFSADASSTYVIRGLAVFSTNNATPDFKYMFNYTGTITECAWHILETPIGSSTTATPVISGGTAFPASKSVTSTNIGRGMVRFELTLKTNASGTFSFQWAQNTSDANAVNLVQGSYMEYKKG